MRVKALQQAAELVGNADAIFIGAGAGMGVDSGLPDFRGNEGFWEAYPPFRELGLAFVDLANPRWFDTDPSRAWGFYGHRMHLYRDTTPHSGFQILKAWAAATSHGAFVFTSNVDGQFQKAGFSDDQVAECHGSIHHIQCVHPCGEDVWPAHAYDVAVGDDLRALPPFLVCPRCGELARPNVLMFGDAQWVSRRSDSQMDALAAWRRGIGLDQVAVIEIGAGVSVPTVRWTCERTAAALDVPLIRINPREAFGPAGTISIDGNALEALEAIDELVRKQ